MIIDGNKIRNEVLEELDGSNKKLSAILVGDDPASRKFLELKGEAAKKIGADFEMYEFSEDITTEDLVEVVKSISEDSSGVIVELPLPKHINFQQVLDAIPIDKDVDVLSTEAQRSFYANESKLLPPAVEAVKIILDEIDNDKKDVVVFGHGLLVGKPIAHWLEANDFNVSIIDEFTDNPKEISKKADIIISGVGKTDLISGDMVKDGVVIIDFGFNKIDGKIKGDANTSAYEKASFYTPVPGGVGPIVVAAVMRNLVKV